MSKSSYLPGDQVVLRRVWHDKICRVTAASVVQDKPDLIALYWGPNYPVMSAKNLLLVTEGEQVNLRKTGWSTNILMIAAPGAAHALYAIWNKNHKLLGWYINLQEPLRRTPVGFDTMDFLLDIDVSPDRSKWSWKDEEQFHMAVKAGNISVGQARDLRSEGERAIKLMQDGPSSFYDAWSNWVRPQHWEIPTFPSGWNKIYKDI